ncbi:hypothetical protein Tco_0125530 [Tanacetum coccineum]
MPRGTTQVVTRGASNDWCAGTVAVRGGGLTNQSVTRGTGVCQYEVCMCQYEVRRVWIRVNHEAVGRRRND